jgi:hypothetical protein
MSLQEFIRLMFQSVHISFLSSIQREPMKTTADCCGTTCKVDLRTAHWVIGSVHLLQALLVLVISKTFLFGNPNLNSDSIGATFQPAPNVLGALASLHADSGLLTGDSSGMLEWTLPLEFDFSVSSNFTALTDDFAGCDSPDILSRSVVFLTPSSDAYNYFCVITYPFLAISSFFVVTALGASRRSNEGSIANSCRSGVASWLLLLIALFTALAVPLTLFVDMFSAPAEGLGKTPLISTHGFVLLCATSLVLGHVLWSFRSHTYTTLQSLYVIVWCGGCGVTAAAPFWVKAEGPWEIFLFVLIGVHFLMAFLTWYAHSRVGYSSSSLASSTEGKYISRDSNYNTTRMFFSGLLVACLLGLHVVYGYEVLQAGLRSPDLWRFTPNETASSIYATERLSIPKVCCQRYGVGSDATPQPGLLIGCVMAAWDKASDFAQLKGVSSQPALSVGEQYSATGLIQLCSVFFFMTAFSHFFSGLHTNESTPGLSPPRWTEYTVTASLMTFAIVVMGPLLNSDDVAAAVLLTAATMCCGFLTEFALAFWLWYGNPNRHLSSGSDSRLIKQTQKSGRPEYASWTEVTVFGWVLFVILWSVIIAGFNQALTDVEIGDATRAVPGFVSAIVITMALLFSVFGVIQLVHIIRFTVGSDKDVSHSDMAKKAGLAKAVGIELAYLLASALTKTTLVWLVIGGTVRDN